MRQMSRGDGGNKREDTMSSDKWKLGVRLFAVFARIGTFAFGGGYAMIHLMQREVAEKRRRSASCCHLSKKMEKNGVILL